MEYKKVLFLFLIRVRLFSLPLIIIFLFLISCGDSVVNPDMTDNSGSGADGSTNIVDIVTNTGVTVTEGESRPVFRYGRSLLTQNERNAYDEIYRQIINMDNVNNDDTYNSLIQITITNSVTYDSLLNKILKYMLYDCPETFNISSRVPRNVQYLNGKVKKFDLSLFLSYNAKDKYHRDLKKVNEKADIILKNINSSMSDIEKIKNIHDEFLKTVSYGGMIEVSGGYITGAFINGKVVCQGYSYGLLYLIQRAALEGVYLNGYLLTNPSKDEWGLHAWNAVKNGGEWYYIDSTGDDSINPSEPNAVYYRHFMKGTANFYKEHKYIMGTRDESIYTPMPSVSLENAAY